jgi:hypothetical protein
MVMLAEPPRTGGEQFAQLRNLATEDGRRTYERLVTISDMLRDKEWVGRSFGGNYMTAVKAMAEYLPGNHDPVEFLNIGLQLLDRFEEEEWRKYRYNVVRLRAILDKERSKAEPSAPTYVTRKLPRQPHPGLPPLHNPLASPGVQQTLTVLYDRLMLGKKIGDYTRDELLQRRDECPLFMAASARLVKAMDPEFRGKVREAVPISVLAKIIKESEKAVRT